MEKAEFFRILKKYNNGTASEQEKTFINTYYSSFETRPDIVELLDADDKESLKKQIKLGLQQQINSVSDKKIKKLKPFALIAVAALILMTVSFGIYFYVAWENGYIYPAHYYAKHDLPPGGNKAILTLANGQQIILSNNNTGVLATQGSIKVVKLGNGQIAYNGNPASALTKNDVAFNTVTIPRGGQYQVILPDGSRVLLNSGSSIHFPTAFKGNERKVDLTGEAYFEVAHDKTKPFRVIAGLQTIEVLGTHFNVNAYADEGLFKTTLVEGSVKISNGNKNIIIKPGEQAQTKTGSGEIEVVSNADVEQAVAWKNGLFQFKDADLPTVMKNLSRWYDVDIEYDGVIPARKFSGKIYRSINISQALEIINFSGIHFRMEKASGSQRTSKIIVTP